ncbi:MAG: hypothetical protein KGZ63_11235 [Clostridiales bacterium]|jgi:hypothetical protein|nr:hypothetical protein [Clostridiales bacterium]
MRQAVTTTKKNWVTPFFLLLFAGAMLVTGVSFPVAEKEPLPTLAEVIAAKVSETGDFSEYSLEIEENGPEYTLQFSGLVRGREIYGTLSSYDLEVYARQGRYYVRGGDLLEDWHEVKGVELDGLPEFVQNPQIFIRMLLMNENLIVDEGVTRTVDGDVCQTYFLHLPSSDVEMLTGVLSGLDGGQVSAYLWFGEDDGFLYKVTLQLDIATGDHMSRIYRTYTMKPQKSELPADLPEPGNRVLEI